ncbi:MAG: twin-arginine translocase TatA/TatE family subunit [Planctomycetes bacterium]|nr:twin-arginine translocase TatA/TatE family subunit [Planctomycetota bacterium]
MPGGMEWFFIGLVALLLFGKRLPGAARSLGQAMHEFRAGFTNTEPAGQIRTPDDTNAASSGERK